MSLVSVQADVDAAVASVLTAITSAQATWKAGSGGGNYFHSLWSHTFIPGDDATYACDNLAAIPDGYIYAWNDFAVNPGTIQATLKIVSYGDGTASDGWSVIILFNYLGQPYFRQTDSGHDSTRVIGWTAYSASASFIAPNLRRDIFTSSGTWTCPGSGTVYVNVYGRPGAGGGTGGAGGGGAGGSHATGGGGGGGGGPGSKFVKTYFKATGGNAYTVTIGAGGSAGTAGAAGVGNANSSGNGGNGGNGGKTSFDVFTWGVTATNGTIGAGDVGAGGNTGGAGLGVAGLGSQGPKNLCFGADNVLTAGSGSNGGTNGGTASSTAAYNDTISGQTVAAQAGGVGTGGRGGGGTGGCGGFGMGYPGFDLGTNSTTLGGVGGTNGSAGGTGTTGTLGNGGGGGGGGSGAVNSGTGNGAAGGAGGAGSAGTVIVEYYVSN